MFLHKNKIHDLSSMKVIAIGYCSIIILGSILLMLPIATRERVITSPVDAIFTAASATCVTGLVQFDTYTYWSLFGQIVILALIQIGGIGFMTFAISFATLTKKKIGLNKRFIMQESVAAPQLGGIVRMTRFIIIGTLFFEGLGVILLAFYFCPRIGFIKGLYFSIFHAISAFCNAGFDLMGETAPFSSLTAYENNYYINIIIMGLIIIGGLGFFVWYDISLHSFHFKEFRLHTKLVITVTSGLILFGTIFIFLFELGGNAYVGKSFSEKMLTSLFQAVTPRTAGFNTIDISNMTQASQFLIICFMLIGGSPGSTAGGIKTTTLAVCLLSVFTTFRHKKGMECYGRRIDSETVKNAFCVVTMYIMLMVGSTMLLSSTERIPIHLAMFEVTSAIGTVGLTMGLTPSLSILSEIIITILMIIGRVGSITILLAFASDRRTPPSRFPVEKIRIG